MNAGGRGEDRGIVFHGPSVWLWLYLNLRACYIYSCDYVAMTAATVLSLYRKRTTIYVFLSTAWVSALSYTLSIVIYAWIRFAWPLPWFFFWENLIKSSLGASKWARRGGGLNPSVEPVLHTSLKSSPFLPWNLKRAACSAFSRKRSWAAPLPHHSSRASKPLSCFLERGARPPVCLPVCLSSVWTPAAPQSASREQISLRLPFPSQH